MAHEQGTDEVSRYKNLGELQDLLLKACPPDSNGRRSIPVLAKHLGVSYQYIYRWIETESVPPTFVTKLVEISSDRVSFADFHRYVF